MRHRVIVSLILICVLLAGGVGLATLLVKTRAPAATTDVPHPPLFVEVVEVRPQTAVEPIVGYGTARADRYARLSAQVAGEIVEVSEKLKPGRGVRAGELLLRIDERVYRERLKRVRSILEAEQAQLARLDVEKRNVDQLIAIAQQERDIARSDFERVKALLEGGESHPREFDQYHRALEQANSAWQVLENQKAMLPSRRAQQKANCANRRADVELAQLDLDHCRVTAPFDGRIDEQQVELGERVQVGQQLLTLLDPWLIEVPIELPLSLRSRVRADARCRLWMESAPEVRWEGQVRRIAPAASEATRTFRIYVEVDNRKQAEELMAGAFVRAVVDGPTLRDVILVPRGVIQQGHVFVYESGQAWERPVQVERDLREQSVVRGLEPGQIVIVTNLDALYDGASVRIGRQPAGRRPTAGETRTADRHPPDAETSTP